MVMLLGGFLFSWIITKVSSALNADSAEALGAGYSRCCWPHVLVSVVKLSFGSGIDDMATNPVRPIRTVYYENPADRLAYSPTGS